MLRSDVMIWRAGGSRGLRDGSSAAESSSGEDAADGRGELLALAKLRALLNLGEVGRRQVEVELGNCVVTDVRCP